MYLQLLSYLHDFGEKSKTLTFSKWSCRTQRAQRRQYLSRLPIFLEPQPAKLWMRRHQRDHWPNNPNGVSCPYLSVCLPPLIVLQQNLGHSTEESNIQMGRPLVLLFSIFWIWLWLSALAPGPDWGGVVFAAAIKTILNQYFITPILDRDDNPSLPID